MVAGRLSDSHLAAIGRVIVEWSLLEFEIMNIAANCLRLSRDEALIVIPQLRFYNCLTISRRSLCSQYQEIEHKINFLLDCADELSKGLSGRRPGNSHVRGRQSRQYARSSFNKR